VSNEERGKAIRERREQQDRLSVRKLARMAGIARGTLARAEDGHSNEATYRSIEHLLDRIEAGEMPPTVPVARAEAEPSVHLFEFEGEHVKVVAHVSADSPEELRAAVAAIVQGIRNGEEEGGLDRG
jgi:predicted transcriptional regulator